MRPFAAPRLLLPLLLASLVLPALAGCASAGRRAALAEGAQPAFADLHAIDVLVFSELPYEGARQAGLAPLQLRDSAVAWLRRGGVPVVDERPPASVPSYVLALRTLELAPGDHAAWVSVELSEVVRSHRHALPLMVRTWTVSEKMRVRAGQPDELWRTLHRLTGHFVREYHAANPSRSAEGAERR